MKLRYYVIRRVFGAFITIILVVFVSFLLIYTALLREPRIIAEQFGGNMSLPGLFFTYLGNVFEGNLGYVPGNFVVFAGLPLGFVMTLLLPDTLQLLFVSLVLSLLISIPVGTHIGTNQGSVSDHISRVYTFFFYGMPVIFTALLLQILLAKGGILGLGLPDTGPFSLGIVAPGFMKYGITYPTHVPIIDGLINGNLPFAWSAFEHLIMPSLVLAFWCSSAFTRFLRNDMIEHIHDPHIIAARSRGIPERTVIRRYVRRNSYIPLLSLLGPLVSTLASWVVVTEIVFGYPGIGNFMVDSFEYFYLGGLATTLMVFGILVVLMNLTADILYAVLDPRIRY